MKNQFVIRKAVPNDAEAIIQLMNEAGGEQMVVVQRF